MMTCDSLKNLFFFCFVIYDQILRRSKGEASDFLSRLENLIFHHWRILNDKKECQLMNERNTDLK